MSRHRARVDWRAPTGAAACCVVGLLLAVGLGTAAAVPRGRSARCSLLSGWGSGGRPGLRSRRRPTGIAEALTRRRGAGRGVVTAGLNPKPVPGGKLVRVRFGRLDTLYQVGDWVVLFWSTHIKNLYAWYGKRARVVVELVRSANGWYHWRKGGQERIVWSDGGTSTTHFNYRPWLKSTRGMVRSGTKIGDKASFKGSSGTTTFEVLKGGLRITTPDNGQLTLRRGSAVIEHLLYNRSKTVFHK